MCIYILKLIIYNILLKVLEQKNFMKNKKRDSREAIIYLDHNVLDLFTEPKISYPEIVIYFKY
jgi:hypothetical protein